jgi:NADH:ubiquinone oxidoreductase subunit E/NAD-dependent dihydropyrimidine dehydrogenase PreA subunit
MIQQATEKVGAVLVVGGGVGGMQASLDLAEAGYKVYLVEKGPSIGGVMSQLDKTFPTNDCAMCTLAPRMVDCGRHLNIEKMTYSEVESIEGAAGNFTVSIRRKARFVDPGKCTGCGECVQKCLVKNIVYLEPPAVPKVELEADNRVKVDQIIGRYEGGRESLVPILQGITNEFNWLPQEMLMRVAEVKQIPIEHILRIATFYKAFSLKPRGKHIVTVCMGTACHVKGAPRIIERFERELGIATGQTTRDMQFTLDAVRCLGCCGLSPVVTVGEDLYGRLSPAKAAAILEKYRD